MRVVVALCFFTLVACERAGADFENATSRPIVVASALRPQVANGSMVTFSVAPGGTVQSVWYVGEHRFLQLKYASGRIERYEGERLSQLAQQCPKHCILRVTDSGVSVIKTNVFGEPKS